MISLDQILLLEKKVESAVAKIAQLQAENDALRTKCSELTNALSSKSEQLSSFEQDQNRIENGILKALDRLSAIENSVLKAAGQSDASEKNNIPTPPVSEPVQNTVQTPSYQNNFQNPVSDINNSKKINSEAETASSSQDEVQPESIYNSYQPVENNAENTKQFYDINQVPQQIEEQNQEYTEEENDTDDSAQFDIF